MKILATNKRARYDYDITENMVAGLVLSGAEVKSVKQGAISLKGSFVSFRGNEAYLTNAHITPYKYAASSESYDPTASRKLLLHRKELNRLLGEIQSAGKTAIPTAVGLERGLIKVEIGIGRGKKQYDKRETIKKRDMLRDVSRDIRK
jgi:SsrA-binding protein